MSKGDQRTSVGVVALDPLRLIGLQAILEETGYLDPHAVPLDEAIAAKDLTVIVLDGLCVADLPEALAWFRRERPAAKVVVFGEGLDSVRIQNVIASGARGYLPETATEAEIRSAMKTVLEGSVWAPLRVLSKLIETHGIPFVPGKRAERFAEQMTPREFEVLQLLKDGHTNRQIAQAMGIEPVTVKAHLGRMLRKAGVTNRVELTLKALAEGPDSSRSKKSKSQESECVR
jgi:DNA-binding NarL/FixJ family response regulator